MSDGDLEARVEALETRIAYQDDTIETLNRTVSEQWKEIDRLKHELSKLGEQVEDAVSSLPAVDRPPPHY